MNLFDKVNQQIQEILKNQNIDFYKQKDNQHKLPTSDAVFCAEDTIRNRYFFKAIQKAIKDTNKKDITIVDAWSGTWILWIMALHLGAKKVIFIEENPYSLNLSKKIVEFFDLWKKVEFYNKDANNIELKEKIDILISETIKTNFKNEDFPHIIKNFQNQFWNTFKIIPEWFKLNFYTPAYELLFTKLFNSYNLSPPYQIDSNWHKKVFIDWTSYMYKDIYLNSWECMSYFNILPLSKNEESSMFNLI